jgi:hypothetical protein
MGFSQSFLILQKAMEEWIKKGKEAKRQRGSKIS